MYSNTGDYYSVMRKKEEGNPAIYYNMDGPRGHYVKWQHTGLIDTCYIAKELLLFS